MIGWGLQGTVPLPAGERLVPRGEARATGQTPSAPNGMCAIPRGRKAGGLRNRDEMVGTGPDIWRTDTMGLGDGRAAAIGSEAQARRELTTKPSRQ